MSWRCHRAATRQCSTPRRRFNLLPALRAWAPLLLVISAGFDVHRNDPLVCLKLEDDDFHWITQELMAVAAESAQGRIVSILEGGYSAACTRPDGLGMPRRRWSKLVIISI